MTGSSDRGQAYTLESLIAALLLVTAVLFALQSVVITPTSAGLQDRDVSAQQHQLASDVLTTAANDDELSRLARFWDCSDGSFATDTRAGNWIRDDGYPTDTAPVEDFGESLNHTFDAGTRYNLLLVYEEPSGDKNVSKIIYQGTPGNKVIAASHTITLTDDQLVTGRSARNQTLASCANPAIPEAGSGPVYNVVEVRLVLW